MVPNAGILTVGLPYMVVLEVGIRMRYIHSVGLPRLKQIVIKAENTLAHQHAGFQYQPPVYVRVHGIDRDHFATMIWRVAHRRGVGRI